MKNRNHLILAALLLLPFTASTAFAGPGTDGTGNAVCNSVTKECKMVEQLQKQSLSTVKGYALFQEKLEALRKDFPDLADAIEDASKKKAWYFVPREFDVLSLKQTGDLRFSTTQAAYQNDKEIFVSQMGEDVASYDEEAAAYRLMHESVMAMQAVRDATKVRILTGKIFSGDSKAIQEAAALNGFGVYFTQEQSKQQKQVARLSYLEALDSDLDFQQGQCHIDPVEWAKMVKSEHGNEAKLYASFVKDMTAHTEDVSQSGWLLPFLNFPNPIGGLVQGARAGIKMPGVFNGASTLPALAAQEHPKSYSKEFVKFLNKLPEGGDTEWTTESLSNNWNYQWDSSQADTARIREYLAKNESFTDLLAILYVRSGNSRDWHVILPQPELDSVRPILETVASKFHSVPGNQPKILYTRICGDIASIRADIAKLQEKLGQKKSPTPPAVESDLNLNDEPGPTSPSSKPAN